MISLHDLDYLFPEVMQYGLRSIEWMNIYICEHREIEYVLICHTLEVIKYGFRSGHISTRTPEENIVVT